MGTYQMTSLVPSENPKPRKLGRSKLLAGRMETWNCRACGPAVPIALVARVRTGNSDPKEVPQHAS
jgi:hypothetical protein